MPEDPKPSAETLPSSPNPMHAAQMLQAAMAGDPTKALDALEKAGVVSPEMASKLRDEAGREKAGLAVLSQEVAAQTEVIRLLAHTIDNFNVFSLGRLDLVCRSLKKCIPGFREAYDKLEADRAERQRLADVAAKSRGSPRVATPKAPPKVA